MSNDRREDCFALDTIDIEELTVRTVIGVFAEERHRKQEVLLHLRLYTDISRAAATDSIDDATNYKRVTKRVVAFVEDTRFFLLETLAERVAELILAEFPVAEVRVRAEKPGALRYARTVAVTIHRARRNSR